ncbi:uncharacterized protein LOC141608427 [Silene latifolia]|uniref:uncharacterized protein LOC141608427 n=1 Tax=Silene latifolia TaxID=37657 RepID=UPI003D76DEA2
MSIKSRRKFGFVNGSIKKPTNKFDLENWEAVHCTIVQWIRNMTGPSVLETVSYVDDASILWAELQAQFDVVDGTKIHGLKTQLHNCKQIKGMDVTTYYGKLKTIWDSLVLHEPPFACTCGKCECGIAKAALQRLDNERLHQFFMGLDSSLYGNVTAFAVPPASQSSIDWRVLKDQERGERRQLFCSHCETKGHEITNCIFKTNRFPSGWGERPRTLAEYRRSRTGGCRGASGSGSNASGLGTTGDKEPSAHVNALITGATAHSLLASNSLSGMYNWILDTGAFNHVTGTLSCLEDVQTITSRPVCLPNGQQVVSTTFGSVYINQLLTLRNVLYLQSLKCNLISISQLTADTNYSFEFSQNSYLIQDRSLRTTIGVGELRDGLYWICAEERTLVANNVTAQGAYDLWHRRMGHPSDKVVKTIPSLSSLQFNNISVCDICHFAKQHRHSFTLNNKRASNLFDSIHCDLWGSYRIALCCGAKYFLTIVDDYSRTTWVYLLRDKVKVTDMFMSFVNMVATQFSKTIKNVRS